VGSSASVTKYLTVFAAAFGGTLRCLLVREFWLSTARIDSRKPINYIVSEALGIAAFPGEDTKKKSGAENSSCRHRVWWTEFTLI